MFKQPDLPFLMPFGVHKGKRLDEVPTSYLRWLATTKLSTGFRARVAAILTARGHQPPPAPPPAPVHPCWRCGNVGFKCTWLQDTLGRKRIKRSCRRCGGSLGFAPHLDAFISEADANAYSAPVLDVLIALEELGIELFSDGKDVRFQDGDYHRVPREMHDRIRQCKNDLARMIGDSRRTSEPPPIERPL